MCADWKFFCTDWICYFIKFLGVSDCYTLEMKLYLDIEKENRDYSDIL